VPFNGGGKRVNVLAIQSPIEEAARGARLVTHDQDSLWRWRFCSTKKTVKAAFQFFMFSEVRDVNSEGTNAKAACWAGWPQLGLLLLGHKIRTVRAKEERAARVSLGQNRELRLGSQKRIEKGFGIFTAKLNLNQGNSEFKSKYIFKVKLQFKLEIKFKTFIIGILGLVSKIEIKTRTLNQRASNKTKQDFEIQGLNLFE
jgi:hypothetical protein